MHSINIYIYIYIYTHHLNYKAHVKYWLIWTSEHLEKTTVKTNRLLYRATQMLQGVFREHTHKYNLVTYVSECIYEKKISRYY